MLCKAEADLVVHHQHRLGRIARKDRVALAVDRHVGSCVGKRAAAGSGDLISGIAADDERVRRARHAARAGHVGGVRGRVDAVGQAQDGPFVKHKGVVARAGEVDFLEVLERRCRGRRDVERGRAAVEAQYIGARAAIDPERVARIKDEHIVAGAADQHVVAGAAVDRVVAQPADQDVVSAGSCQSIISGGAGVRHPGEFAAEEHVTGARFDQRIRVGEASSDDDIVKAVAVDVPGGAHGGAGFIVVRHAVEAEAGGAVEGREIDGGRKTARLAEDHVTSASFVVGAGRSDNDIVEAVAVDVPGGAHGGAGFIVFRHPVEAEARGVSSLDGTTGFRLDGEANNDRSGRSVSAAGDVNGDGFDDVIVGAYVGNPDSLGNAGKSHVVFGKASGFFVHHRSLGSRRHHGLPPRRGGGKR